MGLSIYGVKIDSPIDVEFAYLAFELQDWHLGFRGEYMDLEDVWN